jgi:AcrR family transcriptional regulator
MPALFGSRNPPAHPASGTTDPGRDTSGRYSSRDGRGDELTRSTASQRSDTRRRYSSPRRTEQSEETRLAVLQAALDLFTHQGFNETSIRQVAERADVSDQTVYNTFGDKIGLLEQAGYMFMSREDPAEVAFLEALRAEPDPGARIRMVARQSREFWEQGAEPILQLELLVLYPATRDPRLDELAARSMAHKLAGTRAICEILFPDGVRRAGLSLDTIAEFATSVDAAAALTVLQRMGWDMDRWERWVTDLLTLFLDPAKASPW